MSCIRRGRSGHHCSPRRPARRVGCRTTGRRKRLIHNESPAPHTRGADHAVNPRRAKPHGGRRSGRPRRMPREPQDFPDVPPFFARNAGMLCDAAPAGESSSLCEASVRRARAQSPGTGNGGRRTRSVPRRSGAPSHIPNQPAAALSTGAAHLATRSAEEAFSPSAVTTPVTPGAHPAVAADHLLRGRNPIPPGWREDQFSSHTIRYSWSSDIGAVYPNR